MSELRVLIAFDGSPSARCAVARAAALFPAAEAVVATVAAGLGELADAASGARVALGDSTIRTAVGRLRASEVSDAHALAESGAELAAGAGLRVRAATLAADAGAPGTLIAAAGRLEADAIACGTHGLGPTAGAILGSVSSGLVRHASVPVLLVPCGAVEASGPVVIAFDDSEPSAHAVIAAARLLPGRAAVLVHRWRSPIRHNLAGQAFRHAPLRGVRETFDEIDATYEGWVREDLDHGVSLAREHGLAARARAVESAGPAARALSEAAAEEDAAAIVVARVHRASFASSVLREGGRAVLVA